MATADSLTQLDEAQRWRLISDLLGHIFIQMEPQTIRLIVTWMQLCLAAQDQILIDMWEKLPETSKTPRHLHP